MGYDKPDLYNQPEQFGFEVVGRIAVLDEYGYDWLIMWHHPETGAFYVGETAGCSCTTPGEEFESPSDATRVLNLQHLRTLLNDYIEENTYEWTSVEDRTRWQNESINLVQKYLHLRR